MYVCVKPTTLRVEQKMNFKEDKVGLHLELPSPMGVLYQG